MATHSSVLAWRIPGTGEAWWAAVYGIAQSRTQLKRLSSSSSSLSISLLFPPVDSNLLGQDAVIFQIWFFFFFFFGIHNI